MCREGQQADRQRCWSLEGLGQGRTGGPAKAPPPRPWGGVWADSKHRGAMSFDFTDCLVGLLTCLPSLEEGELERHRQI